ncbi:MAG TPA: ABC transporter substrate-binding protein [Acidimicrobiia bacterium]|nr:ABC transporter substrate-binding protein [Acidimicrobiia bacterium]
MTRLRWLTVLCVFALVAGACSRDKESTDAGDTNTPTSGSTETSGGGDADAAGLDQGGFGDLGVLCSEAPADEPNAATGDVGVTADSIQVSTFSDPGFSGRLGLNQELFDTADAFTSWCNEHGGIHGRQIELKKRDAKLTEFQQRVIEACDEGDFMMIGGGNVLDDTGQTDRLGCATGAVPQIPGYVVTPQAAESDLTQQPVPNTGDEQPVGGFNYLAEKFPDTKDAIGIFTGDIQTTITVADRNKEALQILGGYNIVYEGKYNPLGETSWRTYIEAMRSAGVKGLVYVGEPSNLAAFLTEAQSVGMTFDWVWSAANIYDPAIENEAGAAADNLYVTTGFYPFGGDLAKGNEATQQYLDLIDQYSDNGKVANLGLQAMSAWLLFAKATGECGADVTRDCVWEKAKAIKEWTGGGLNAPQDLSAGTASDCGALLDVKGGKFELTDIGANEGIYLCDPANIVTLKNDYGSGVTCPNPAFADDPKPSNCAG